MKTPAGGDAFRPPMISSVTVKRTLKQTAGWTAVLTKPFVTPHPLLRGEHPGACILVYHRIADPGFIDPGADDWNVPPAVFERQIALLASFTEIVPLLELPRRLSTASPFGKPLVCLTFDDGFANFYTRALPILRRYHAPATIFVVTGLIGHPGPLPFDRWAQRNWERASPETYRSLQWRELEACLATGLITVGAHSHRHLCWDRCTTAQLIEEAQKPREILESRLGEVQSRAFAYPYGSMRRREISPHYVSAVRASGYQLAVTTDVGLALPGSDPCLLPRVEASAHDSRPVLRAKVSGALAPYSWMQWLLSTRRRA